MLRVRDAVAYTIMITFTYGQSAESLLRFEVASVKPGKSPTSFDITPRGGVTANCDLKFLLQVAFQVKDYQIVGGPSWIGSEYFHIVAQPPDAGANPEQSKHEMPQRLQQLLNDRFELRAHLETKEGWVQALVVAKNGPKLAEVPPGNFRLRLAKGRIINDGGARMAMLATMLSNVLGRPVLDKTGLTGFYKFELAWTPDSSALPDSRRERADSGCERCSIIGHGTSGTVRVETRATEGAHRNSGDRPC